MKSSGGQLLSQRLGVFFSSRRRHTICLSDWSSDVCSSDLDLVAGGERVDGQLLAHEVGVRADLGLDDEAKEAVVAAHEGNKIGRGRHRRLALALEIGRASCRERG